MEDSDIGTVIQAADFDAAEHAASAADMVDSDRLAHSSGTISQAE